MFLFAAPRAGEARIVIGLSSVNIAFLPVYVAQEKGFFKYEGSTFNSSCLIPVRLTESLMGGDIQMMGQRLRRNLGGRAAGYDIKNLGASVT